MAAPADGQGSSAVLRPSSRSSSPTGSIWMRYSADRSASFAAPTSQLSCRMLSKRILREPPECLRGLSLPCNGSGRSPFCPLPTARAAATAAPEGDCRARRRTHAPSTARAIKAWCRQKQSLDGALTDMNSASSRTSSTDSPLRTRQMARTSWEYSTCLSRRMGIHNLFARIRASKKKGRSAPSIRNGFSGAEPSSSPYLLMSKGPTGLDKSLRRTTIRGMGISLVQPVSRRAQRSLRQRRTSWDRSAALAKCDTTVVTMAFRKMHVEQSRNRRK
mmetsp:Transcript_60829/g.108575  ORF Transcript_60829/g.108575 Transcript_60829/m.108575 type:complete len:275 (+) Transcript_60829:1-825(+)